MKGGLWKGECERGRSNRRSGEGNEGEMKRLTGQREPKRGEKGQEEGRGC